VFLLCAAIGAAGCNRPAPARAEAKEPPPLPADVQAVAPAPAQAAALADSKDAFSGEFRSPVHSELVSKVSGRVGKLHVDEGDRVRKGQPLLELESDYLELDVQRAEAELQRAQAAASDAEKDFERKKGLAAKESVAQAVFERSQAAAQGAAAAHRAAQAAVELARQRLRDAVLTSPIDGVVVERRVDVGEHLGDSTVAFLIQQTAPLKLRFRIPERYLGRVKAGMPVAAAVAPYPDQTFPGKVSVVGSAIDPATRTFLVEAEFGNADGRLKPGLFARIEADLGRADLAKKE
jgi:RND family efflux transporter MFP subunit